MIIIHIIAPEDLWEGALSDLLKNLIVVDSFLAADFCRDAWNCSYALAAYLANNALDFASLLAQLRLSLDALPTMDMGRSGVLLLHIFASLRVRTILDWISRVVVPWFPWLLWVGVVLHLGMICIVTYTERVLMLLVLLTKKMMHVIRVTVGSAGWLHAWLSRLYAIFDSRLLLVEFLIDLTARSGESFTVLCWVSLLVRQLTLVEQVFTQGLFLVIGGNLSFGLKPWAQICSMQVSASGTGSDCWCANHTLWNVKLIDKIVLVRNDLLQHVGWGTIDIDKVRMKLDFLIFTTLLKVKITVQRVTR